MLLKSSCGVELVVERDYTQDGFVRLVFIKDDEIIDVHNIHRNTLHAKCHSAKFVSFNIVNDVCTFNTDHIIEVLTLC